MLGPRLAFWHSFRCSVWVFSGVARLMANRLHPVLLRPHPGTRAPSLHRHYPVSSVLRAPPPPAWARRQKPSVGPADGATQTGFPCCSPLLVDMLSPTTPAKRIELVVLEPRPIHTSLPPVQAGSAFASCLSGPPRCSLVLRPAHLQTAFRCLLSPRLRPLCHLHDRWDSYPAGTTFAGAGLPPAGTTNLRTAHLDYFSRI